ncbi:alpha/beta fold hydrolase [Pseudoduganella sp. FT25W]|uniref:Alpha/beta fold hydrolase n=1 Tax=Duganella alba TaxID=2666081 RepID=A0A6L5QKT3_9BURK|nr:alpha/beta hydrolase [Duganella alba]MRX09922.1 alpha/beta fold hydrolase [Duganella alba]MRX17559.1 alpha/beta fold hydrolase [Duganella alba]
MPRPTVVFIHGALNDHSVWSTQRHYLAQHDHPVLALDLPGHGATPGPALDTIAAMADWLLATLDAAGIAQAALVGHSMGSLIALEAAAKAPQRVSHLALLGCIFPMKVADALLDTARNDEMRAIDMVTKWSHTPGHADTETLRQLMRRMAGANLLYTDLAACNAYDHGEAAAQTVRCPALFIFGAADVMTPPKAARLLTAAMPHAETATLEAGHAMMAEQPDAVSEALAAFIGSR